MSTESDELLKELDLTTDHVIRLVVNNETADLEKSVIRQIQLLKKLSVFPANEISVERLHNLKRKVDQQQLLINQALEVTNLFIQLLHEYSKINLMG